MSVYCCFSECVVVVVLLLLVVFVLCVCVWGGGVEIHEGHRLKQ